MFQPLTLLSWARRLLGMKAPLASEVLCDDCYPGWEMFLAARVGPHTVGSLRAAQYDATLKAFITAERQ